MIRKLMATTALAMLVASGALAQETTTPAPAPATENAAPAAPVVQADGSLVTNIVGESVYNGTAEDAASIGKVTDVVFAKDGQAKSIVIGVGGFLGVGAKNVAFDYDKLKWAEKNGDRWLVAETSKEELTAHPAFDDTPYLPAPPPATPASDGTAAAPSASGGGTATAPAGDTAMAPTPPAEIVEPDGTLASQVVGEGVYNGTADDAQKIGDIKDIVLDKDGKAESLVIGVGGFLGIGQKAVAFDYDKGKWAEKNGDRWIVVEGVTKEQLEGLPDFDRKAYDPAPASTAAAPEAPPVVTPATKAADKGDAVTDKTAEAPAASGAMATDETKTAAIDKSMLTEMPADKISADTLIGTTVYGADDTNIGKIGDVVLTPDNKVDAIVVDVGGFLGIGSKPVAVGMDKLKFMTDKDGNTYLYTNFTKDQLQAQAAYDKGSYADKRDEQRMILR